MLSVVARRLPRAASSSAAHSLRWRRFFRSTARRWDSGGTTAHAAPKPPPPPTPPSSESQAGGRDTGAAQAPVSRNPPVERERERWHKLLEDEEDTGSAYSEAAQRNSWETLLQSELQRVDDEEQQLLKESKASWTTLNKIVTENKRKGATPRELEKAVFSAELLPQKGSPRHKGEMVDASSVFVLPEGQKHQKAIRTLQKASIPPPAPAVVADAAGSTALYASPAMQKIGGVAPEVGAERLYAADPEVGEAETPKRLRKKKTSSSSSVAGGTPTHTAQKLPPPTPPPSSQSKAGGAPEGCDGSRGKDAAQAPLERAREQWQKLDEAPPRRDAVPEAAQRKSWGALLQSELQRVDDEEQQLLKESKASWKTLNKIVTENKRKGATPRELEKAVFSAELLPQKGSPRHKGEMVAATDASSVFVLPEGQKHQKAIRTLQKASIPPPAPAVVADAAGSTALYASPAMQKIGGVAPEVGAERLYAADPEVGEAEVLAAPERLRKKTSSSSPSVAAAAAEEEILESFAEEDVDDGVPSPEVQASRLYGASDEAVVPAPEAVPAAALRELRDEMRLLHERVAAMGHGGRRETGGGGGDSGQIMREEHARFEKSFKSAAQHVDADYKAELVDLREKHQRVKERMQERFENVMKEAAVKIGDNDMDVLRPFHELYLQQMSVIQQEIKDDMNRLSRTHSQSVSEVSLINATTSDIISDMVTRQGNRNLRYGLALFALLLLLSLSAGLNYVQWRFINRNGNHFILTQAMEYVIERKRIAEERASNKTRMRRDRQLNLIAGVW